MFNCVCSKSCIIFMKKVGLHLPYKSLCDLDEMQFQINWAPSWC